MGLWIASWTSGGTPKVSASSKNTPNPSGSASTVSNRAPARAMHLVSISTDPVVARRIATAMGRAWTSPAATRRPMTSRDGAGGPPSPSPRRRRGWAGCLPVLPSGRCSIARASRIRTTSTPVPPVALDLGPLRPSAIQTPRPGVHAAVDARRAVDRRVALATTLTTAQARDPVTDDALDQTRRLDLTVIPWFAMRLSERPLGRRQRVSRAVVRRTVVRHPKSEPGIRTLRPHRHRTWKSRSRRVHPRLV